MTIGQRIKRRREELQMSQEELANKIGYKSRSSINKIELDLYNLKQSKIYNGMGRTGQTRKSPKNSIRN